MAQVDEDIAQYLDDQGAGIYNTTGSNNIFIGYPRPYNDYIPVKSAWVIASGGPAPDRVFGHAHRINYAAVQIMVRGEQNGYIAGRDFAETIWETLEGSIPTNYFHVFAQQAGPIPIGFDDNGNPMFSLNFIATYQSTI